MQLVRGQRLLFGAVLAVTPLLVVDCFRLQAYGELQPHPPRLESVAGDRSDHRFDRARSHGCLRGAYDAAMVLLAVSAYLVAKPEPPRFDPSKTTDPVDKREVLDPPWQWRTTPGSSTRLRRLFPRSRVVPEKDGGAVLA